MSTKIGVFRPKIWTKSFIWPISKILTPPWYTWLESYGSQLSHGIFKKKNIDPTGRQNFGDAPGQIPKLILTLCHIYMQIYIYSPRLKVTRPDWFDQYVSFYLNSCITVVGGDYSVLNKDKIDWTTRLPPANSKSKWRVSMLLNSNCFILWYFLFFPFPNYVYVCIGLGSGLVNRDMVGPKTKALRGRSIQYKISQYYNIKK